MLLPTRSRKWYPELPQKEAQGSKGRLYAVGTVSFGSVAEGLYCLVPFKSLC